jgi:hypothetical protein
MMQLYEIHAGAVETLPAVRQNPSERHLLPANLEIPEDKAASKQADANARETIKVYTDGSAHEGKVGTAAILTRAGKPEQILQLHMGSTKQHTVYEAEHVGLILGLHLIAMEKKSRQGCVIGLDNKAVIQSLHTELTNPGHHLAAEALKHAKTL